MFSFSLTEETLVNLPLHLQVKFPKFARLHTWQSVEQHQLDCRLDGGLLEGRVRALALVSSSSSTGHTPTTPDDFEQGRDAGTFVQTALADKTQQKPPHPPPIKSHARLSPPF